MDTLVPIDTSGLHILQFLGKRRLGLMWWPAYAGVVVRSSVRPSVRPSQSDTVVIGRLLVKRNTNVFPLKANFDVRRRLRRHEMIFDISETTKDRSFKI